MKNQNSVFKDYVSSLNEEDLRAIYDRLLYRFSGDLGEVINQIDKNKDIAKFFHSAKGPDEMYDILDSIFSFVEKEYKKRFELISR